VLKRVLKGLGSKGHQHTFRHAFIPCALTQGVSEAIVRRWVGQVDTEVTKLHTHIADSASQAAMQRLAGAKQKKPLRTGGSQDDPVQRDGESAQPQHS
jgi:hypothetical protein